jgi:glyoxylase-like metal-dependent hydrolase (beta-lactamase superfamily II)
VGASGGGGSLTWHQVAMPIVSAYLLQRGSEVAIVDCGLPGSQGAIEAGLKAAGSGWDAVKHVVLTHRHPDHVGGLPAVEALVKATLYAGAKDVAAITSARPLKPLRDGDDVFGLRILDTPGHTVGHVSVFDPTTGVLVAGDALRTTSGLQGSDPKFTASPTDAVASVKKLATLDVKVVLPGHGAPLTSGASAALRALVASL